jgi:hypothetical protein
MNRPGVHGLLRGRNEIVLVRLRDGRLVSLSAINSLCAPLPAIAGRTQVFGRVVDEVGVDRLRRFESLAEAAAFCRGLRISRRREPMFGADDSVGRETTHMSGYVGQWEVGEHQAQRRR